MAKKVQSKTSKSGKMYVRDRSGRFVTKQAGKPKSATKRTRSAASGAFVTKRTAVSMKNIQSKSSADFKASLRKASARVAASKRRGSLGHEASRKYLDDLKDAQA